MCKLDYEEKSIQSIVIPYIISDELIIKKTIELPMWANIWLDSKFRILILCSALLILTFITIFQDRISKYRKIFRVIRVSYLSFTLIWIGWYAGAQLSIFNILSIIRIPITGADLSYFIIDPLIFIILVFTIVSALILGRGLFCGWLCPFGALQELIGWIAKNLGIKKKEIPEKYYTKLWTLKYFILVTIIGVSFISMETASTLAEVEPFKTAIMRHFNRGIPYVSYAVALLCLSAFMERGFCRFVCPLGAGLAVIGKLRITDNLKRREECGSPCNLCSTSCPVNAIPSQGKDKGKIIMSECFRCLDCQLEYVDTKRCPPLVKIEKLKVKVLNMQNIITRRNIIKITASAIGMLPYSSFANKNIYNYHWKGLALGNPVEMKVYTKNKNHLEKILTMVSSEIDRLDKIFYLQDAYSKINLLNKTKSLINPDKELLNAIYLSEKFFSIRKPYLSLATKNGKKVKKVISDGIGFEQDTICKK